MVFYKVIKIQQMVFNRSINSKHTREVFPALCKETKPSFASLSIHRKPAFPGQFFFVINNSIGGCAEEIVK